MKFKPAILFFARNADLEARVKSFGQPKKGKAFWEKLHKQIQRFAKSDNADLILSNEKNQRGNTFGERLSHAISEAFESYDQIIVIGGDCPTLHRSDLQKALEILENGHQVLGPDHRGGTWLMGLQKSQWNETKFRSIHWQNATVFQQVKALLSGSLELTILKRKRDLNHISDLKEFLSFKSISWLIQAIHDLINRFQFIPFYHSLGNYSFSPKRVLRGPPSF